MRLCDRKNCNKLATYGVAVKVVVPDLPRPCVIMPDIVVCGTHKKRIKFQDIFNQRGVEHIKDCLRVILEHNKIYEMPKIDSPALDFIPMINMN